MKKYLSVILLISSYSFSQTVQQRAGFYPNGQLGKIYYDTIYVLPRTPLLYWNGYGQFVSLYDSVRPAISLTTTGSGAATYSNVTGVLNVPTPSAGNDSAIWKNSATYTTGNKVLTMANNSQQFAGGRVLFDSIRVGTTRIFKSAQGLDIGFSDSASSNTTNSNIDIVPLHDGTTLVQKFDNITGFGNIKMFASSSNKAKGYSSSGQTISGNNNTLINYGGTSSTLSGSGNTVLGNYVWAGTSGSNNFGIGINALNGVTTGSGNIHISTYAGAWSYGNISNTTILGDISNQGEAFAANDVAFIPGGAFVGANFWLNGRKAGNAGAYPVTLNMEGATGTNAAGSEFSIRTSRGTGTALSGPLYFQTWRSIGTGSTTHSTAATKMLMDTTGVAIGTVLSVSPGTTPSKAGTAVLDLQSTNQSFLPPRMDSTQRNAIVGVTSVTVSGSGTGYTAVEGAFSGGAGNGARAFAVTSGGNVLSITVTASGTGYTSVPTYTQSPGSGQTFTAVLGTPVGSTVFCTNCVATDGSTGVLQTYSAGQWRNHY